MVYNPILDQPPLAGNEVILTNSPRGETTAQDIANLGTNAPSAPTITGGTIDGAVIGGKTPAAGTFTALAATSSFTLSPSGTGAISPTGALTINPTAASTLNNTSVGVTTPAAGKFTTLAASGAVTLTGAPVIGSAAPATKTSTGVAGTITWDSGFVYVCVATNQWKSVAIADF